MSPQARPNRLLGRAFRHRDAQVAAAFLVILGAAALLAPLIAPADPIDQDLASSFAPVSSEHLLGADQLGRDVLSRLLHGARGSLGVALSATVIAALIGVPLGLIVGYARRWTDVVVMRVADGIAAVPAIILAIGIISFLGRGLGSAAIAIGAIYSVMLLRLARGMALSVSIEDYVDAARVMGVRPWRILVRHVLPNCAAPIVVQLAMMWAAAILAEAGLSYLGLAAQPPTPSWGVMLAEASQVLGFEPYLAFPPGIALALTVLAVTTIGDRVRDSLGRGIERGYLVKAVAVPHPEPVAEVSDAVHAPTMIDQSASHATASTPASEPPLLHVQSLDVSFPSAGARLRVVRDVDLTLDNGEIVGVAGESGSGKTLLAMAILGLVPAPGQTTSGTVQLGGRDLAALSDEALRLVRGTEIGLISQDPSTSLNPSLTVGDQVGESLRVHRGYSRKVADARVVELLDMVQIPGAARLLKAYPHQLSGGMAQRVAIAMALATEPALLIADEPTTALDVTVQSEILDLLHELRAGLGTAILLITHDIGVVAQVADRIVVMYAGEIVEEGTTEAVLHSGRHPYTQGLLASLPQPDAEELWAMAGSMPPSDFEPTGCRFAPRCPHADEVCEGSAVPLLTIDQRHVRCVKATEQPLEPVASIRE